MKTVVVYDTVFGNTEKVAQSVGAACTPAAAVVRAGEAGKDALAGAQLVIVGSPTRAFRPTPALRQWIKSLPKNSLHGVRVAAFDTRMDLKALDNKFLTFMVGLFGYAAKPIADALAKKGGTPVLAPEGFIVTASEGPLAEGEPERAAQWAKRVQSAAKGV
ncbi:MAG: flavodoxin family protein [Anaerolineales bacterium]|nr:flavodoxin family protein [Anaerolineales bacterium]